MRKMLLVLSLAALTGLASASDILAQGRGYRGGWGYSPGISIDVGRGGYYSPYGYNGGLGYSSYYQGYGYSSPNYYYATPSYYYATPSYYSEPSYLAPTQVRQAYYTAPATAQQAVNMTVLVPVADAQVWFENKVTTQQGIERWFHSPPLEPNHTFTYTIKARWMADGQTVNRERQVNVQAGQSVTINFRTNAPENVPAPRD